MIAPSHKYANEVADASRTVSSAVDGRMFIDGQRTWSRSGATFEAIDPAVGQVFATVALGDKSDVDAAVAAAPPGARAGLRGGLRGRRGAPVERPNEKPPAAEKPLRQAEDDVAAAAGYFEFFG